MQTTRSIQYGRHGGVELVEVPVRDPQPDEVQIQTLACGVCSWDVHVYKHGSPWQIMPGHEGVGRIVKVGRDVTHLTEGMRVTGHGLGFTELTTLSAGNLYPLPANGHADEHLLVEPVSCVVTGLDHCQLQAGQRLAVVGCGFMGLMLVQGLGRSLAEQVIAIDIDDDRLAMARRFGATATYNPGADNFEQTVQELKALSIDTVIDSTGAQSGLNLASQIVRRGGRLNLFGWNHGQATFPGDIWHMEGITVVNSAPASQLRDPFPPAISLLTRKMIDLEPLVSHVVPLECYSDLLQRAADRADGYIKGVVKFHPA